MHKHLFSHLPAGQAGKAFSRNPDSYREQKSAKKQMQTDALLFLPIFLVLILSACRSNNNGYDASGIFEAQEIVISAEVTGQLLDLSIHEGDSVSADQVVGHIDCTDITLQKSQVEASKESLKLKRLDARPEIDVIAKQVATQEAEISALKTQHGVISKEKDRISTLVSKEAAPKKQLDDVQGEMDVLQKKIAAAQLQVGVLREQMRAADRTASTRNAGIMSEESPLAAQLDRIENQIGNCTIVNPMRGIVIAKYAEQYEIVTLSKPLYKVADLDEMTLRAYLTGDQLTSVKLGQQIKVMVDAGDGKYNPYNGTISWISEKAEFTPKTIQTKNERANLVYAVKVIVQNDGYLRIGMYGEIDLE